MDNMELARLPDSGRLDVKKLGEMWKSLTQPQRDVSPASFDMPTVIIISQDTVLFSTT